MKNPTINDPRHHAQEQLPITTLMKSHWASISSNTRQRLCLWLISLISKLPHDHHYLVNLAALPNARPTSATSDGETLPGSWIHGIFDNYQGDLKKKPEEKVSQKNISEHSRILMEKMDWKFNLWTRNLLLLWRSWLLFLRGSSCGKYVFFLLKLGRLKHVCSTWNMLILV